MPERIEIPDPGLPKPGERTGEGAGSLLPFLRQRRATKPRPPNDFVPTDPHSGPGELPQDPGPGPGHSS